MNMQRLNLALPHATSVRHVSSGGIPVALRSSGGGGGGGSGTSSPYASITRGCELMLPAPCVIKASQPRCFHFAGAMFVLFPAPFSLATLLPTHNLHSSYLPNPPRVWCFTFLFVKLSTHPLAALTCDLAPAERRDGECERGNCMRSLHILKVEYFFTAMRPSLDPLPSPHIPLTT